MNLVEVSLKELVDRALLELRAPTEVGYVFSPPTGELTDASTNRFQVPDTNRVAVSDVLEVEDELMLVTAVNESGFEGQIKVQRGYYGTKAVAHPENVAVTVNPAWPRVRVAEGVKRSFARLEALGLPLLVSTLMFPEPSDHNERRFVLTMPSETREVWSVMYGLEEIEGWSFRPEVPRQVYRNGKVVRLPRWVSGDTELFVTYSVPYRWSTFPDPPDAGATIIVMEGAEDLPAQYAAAWSISAREISRSAIDRTEEWNQNEPLRNGVTTTFLRAKWQEFYRALDEAMRLQPPRPLRILNTRRRRFRGV